MTCTHWLVVRPLDYRIKLRQYSYTEESLFICTCSSVVSQLSQPQVMPYIGSRVVKESGMVLNGHDQHISNRYTIRCSDSSAACLCYIWKMRVHFSCWECMAVIASTSPTTCHALLIAEGFMWYVLHVKLQIESTTIDLTTWFEIWIGCWFLENGRALMIENNPMHSLSALTQPCCCLLTKPTVGLSCPLVDGKLTWTSEPKTSAVQRSVCEVHTKVLVIGYRLSKSLNLDSSAWVDSFIRSTRVRRCLTEGVACVHQSGICRFFFKMCVHGGQHSLEGSVLKLLLYLTSTLCSNRGQHHFNAVHILKVRLSCIISLQDWQDTTVNQHMTFRSQSQSDTKPCLLARTSYWYVCRFARGYAHEPIDYSNRWSLYRAFQH